MNMEKNARVSLVFLTISAIAVLISVMYFVFAGAFSSIVALNNVNEDVYNIYNFTINNDATDTNLTQVKIIFPSSAGFSFVADSNGTSASNTLFSSTLSILTWDNKTANGFVLDQTTQYFWFTASASTPGSYNFRVNITDIAGIVNTTNVAVTINDTTAPSVIVVYPIKRGNYSLSSITFNLAVIDSTGISSCWLILINGTTENTISMSNTSSAFNAIGSTITEMNYTAKFYCNDTNNYLNNSEQVNFTIDRTAPTFTASVSGETSTGGILSVASLSESVSSCTYSGAGSGSLNGSGTSWSATLSSLSASTDYTVTVSCTDSAGNTGSDSDSFTTSSSESSNGDDEATTQTYWITLSTLTNNQLAQGSTKELSVKNRVKFMINSTEHYVGVVALTNTTATINVSSAPQQAIMSVGQEKKFELTNDAFYDVSIKLNGIKNNKANLTIKNIQEEVPVITLAPNATGCTSNWTCTNWSACVNATKTRTCTDSNNCNSIQDKPAELETCKKTSSLWIWLILITIAVAVVAALVILIINKRRD